MAVLFLLIGVSIIIGCLWGLGIISMNEQYPDYKGDDFLNWDDDN